MSEKGFTITVPVHIKRDRRARKVIREGPVPATSADDVARAARMLALAHKWEAIVRRGEVTDYAEIARRHGLSRARVSQVCGLTLLAPDLQESVLLAGSSSPPRPTSMIACPIWREQRVLVPTERGL